MDPDRIDGGICCGDEGCKPLSKEAAQAIYDLAMAQKAEREARYPDEASAIRAVFDGFVRLKDMGWRPAMYAPCDRTALELIEAGSTGIHHGQRDNERRFWIIADGDMWPSTPILFRAARTPTPETPT